MKTMKKTVMLLIIVLIVTSSTTTALAGQHTDAIRVYANVPLQLTRVTRGGTLYADNANAYLSWTIDTK